MGVNHSFRQLPGLGALIIFTVSLLAAGCSPAGQYEPSWESLTTHAVPQWLIDAKFGIYAHWGVYSLPAFGNEWYAKRMYDPKDKLGTFAHHREKYGDQAKFGYKDLIPMFKAENFNPQEWADVIERSGAKYAGIAVVHHDGFGLWDSDVNQWNAGKMGPKRDLYGDLVNALRRKPGMKTIATFHHIRTFDWYLPADPGDLEEGRKAGWDLFDPRYHELYWNRYTGKYEDFITQWRAKVKEVVDKYQPDVLWFDGGKFQEEGAQDIVLDVLSYYCNKGEEWGKEVEVLNKLPTSMKFNFPREFGMLTFEEGRDRPPEVERHWIDDQKISTFSWGYVEGQTYKSADEIVDGLVDRVSRGGGLVLSLCPKADGTLTQEQKDVLLAMGDWLKVNGEAIYASRPWKIHAEGPIEKILKTGGDHSRWIFDACDSGDIRFTVRNNTLYAIALGWPAAGSLTIKTLGDNTPISSGGIEDITLLGSPGTITWNRNADGLTLQLPAQKPNDIAYAFRISVKGVLSQD